MYMCVYEYTPLYTHSYIIMWLLSLLESSKAPLSCTKVCNKNIETYQLWTYNTHLITQIKQLCIFKNVCAYEYAYMHACVCVCVFV